MARYVTQRLLLAALTIWLVSIIVFTLLRVVVPIFYGDAVDVIAAEYSHSDPARAEALREEYGLSGNLVVSYLEWAGNMARGNLGESLFNGRPITKEMHDRLPVSVELGVIGLLSGLLFSVPLGVAAAVAQDRWPDYFLRTFAILLNSLPGFWLAILIITFGNKWFNWAPPLNFAYLTEDPVAHLKIMLLPALLIGLTPSAGLVRLVRTQMLEVLRQDYIRTAHAKGLSDRTVIIRHALRNSLIPVVTVVGLTLPTLIAGTAIFESIFTLPGMGRYLVSSVSSLDYPVIMGTVFVFSVIIVLANLAVDLSYTVLDPRIRY
ncbi:MAG TPA: ABC transporter permease [Tepidiformaceae bacterium]|nr:ABC transporter permease [Thermoflexaceae bacterium]HMS58738.1 ABC transporter permease [Tepidiformaceae bacterium]